EAYYNRGEAFANLKRNEEAIADYSKAIQKGVYLYRSLWGRACGYNSLGLYAQARDDCERAIQIDDTNAGLWVMHGWALANLDQALKAETSFRKAIDIDPDNNNAKGFMVSHSWNKIGWSRHGNIPFWESF
ncbi:MAG: tetratricopeptide repeat protein, partial [Planctomycetia bacterium]